MQQIIDNSKALKDEYQFKNISELYFDETVSDFVFDDDILNESIEILR